LAELAFAIAGMRVVPFAASPAITMDVAVENRSAGVRIESILLRAQVRIEPQKRRYSSGEKERLHEIFGGPTVWDQGLRPMLWVNAMTVVSAFEERTTTAIDLPCTYDLSAASAKYFAGLETGTVPLVALFSGTVFQSTADPRSSPEPRASSMSAHPLSWTHEARFALPISVWKEAIESCHPGRAALVMQREVLDRLQAYRRREGLATTDEALERLLRGAT
jgi:hypothetical protein